MSLSAAVRGHEACSPQQDLRTRGVRDHSIALLTDLQVIGENNCHSTTTALPYPSHFSQARALCESSRPVHLDHLARVRSAITVPVAELPGYVLVAVFEHHDGRLVHLHGVCLALFHRQQKAQAGRRAITSSRWTGLKGSISFKPYHEQADQKQTTIFTESMRREQSSIARRGASAGAKFRPRTTEPK